MKSLRGKQFHHQMPDIQTYINVGLRKRGIKGTNYCAADLPLNTSFGDILRQLNRRNFENFVISQMKILIFLIQPPFLFLGASSIPRK